jgi:putative transposase
MSLDRRRAMIEPERSQLSIARQCALVGIGRSTFYRTPVPETAENVALMRLLDEQFLETPWYGTRQMARHLRRLGHVVGRKRVRRLMAKMGWRRSTNGRAQPFRIRSTGSIRICCAIWVDRPNQVWCADITYIPMRRGFLYLAAVMDWSTRRVLSWRLSNTMMWSSALRRWRRR